MSKVHIGGSSLCLLLLAGAFFLTLSILNTKPGVPEKLRRTHIVDESGTAVSSVFRDDGAIIGHSPRDVIRTACSSNKPPLGLLAVSAERLSQVFRLQPRVVHAEDCSGGECTGHYFWFAGFTDCPPACFGWFREFIDDPGLASYNDGIRKTGAIDCFQCGWCDYESCASF